jgi:hypothetical protein
MRVGRADAASVGAAAPEPVVKTRSDRSAAWPTTVLAWVERESLLFLISVLYAATLLVRLPNTLGADSWLTLVAGRELWERGLPSVDALTAWSHGTAWVDQQWLAQLGFEGLAAIGGVKLALLGHAGLLIAAFLLAVVAARRLGGNARAVALVAALALPQLAQQWQLRAQSFAYVLFVAVLVLLISDARWGGRRVLLCLPLLALWGNLHGSVLIGAALVSLRGLILIRQRRRTALAVCLVTLPWLCVLLSPYAASLPGYYAGMLFGHDFSALVTEWGPTIPGLMTAPFYALAFGAVWLLARNRQATGFEQLALLLLLVAGMLAMRNMVWFSLTAMVVLPRLLRETQQSEATRVVKLGLPLAAAAMAAAVALTVVSRPNSWYERGYSPEIADAVAAAADRHAGFPVVADLGAADWLLWQERSLRGRIQYDARLELLTKEQLLGLYHWQNHIGDWEEIQGCRALVLVDLANDPLTEASLLRRGDVRRLYRDHGVSLLLVNRAATCS